MSNSPRAGLAVAGLSLGTSLNPLNSSMIAVALVVLRADFGLDVATVTWVITAFYLTSAAGQPLMGRFADRFGPRRLFMLGMALVAVTCALAPFAPNFALLCVARAFMALGTATAYPSAVVMVGEPAREANVKSTRPLGRIQMANTSAAAVGPVVGGLLVSLVGWQALFLINVPLSLAGDPGGPAFRPGRRGRERGRVSELLRDSDLPGIRAFLGALVLVMMALLNVLPAYRWWLLAGGHGARGAVRLARAPVRPPFLTCACSAATGRCCWSTSVLRCSAPSIILRFSGCRSCCRSGRLQSRRRGGADAPARGDLGGGTPFAVRAIDRFGVSGCWSPASCCSLSASGGDVAADGVLRRSAGAGADRPAGRAVLGGRLSSSQGMYLSTRPEERGVPAGIFQTCRYLGAITATVLIGIFYGTGREPGELGTHGVRHAGARRGGACRVAAVAGAGGLSSAAAGA